MLPRIFCALVLWLVCVAIPAHGQQVTAAEYFLNTDPGAGKGITIPVSNASNSVTVTFTPDISALETGFHVLYVRSRDNESRWGIPLATAFYKPATQPGGSTLPNITAAEFFLNTDPGTGNGTPVDIGTLGTEKVLTFTPNTTALESGFHVLYVRSRDARGLWGMPHATTFYKPAPQPGGSALPNITAAEFFLNTDPGAGNGTSIQIGTLGTEKVLTFTPDVSALESGFHQLYVRSRDSRGIWGMPHATTFYKPAPQPNGGAIPDIAAAEFFLNTDPGPGNGISVQIGTFGTEKVLTFTPDVSALESGFHQLYVRSRDTRGIWGMPHATTFYKPAPQPNGGAIPDIAAAEFFLNTDPGLGMGTPVEVGTLGNEVVLTFSPDIAALDPGFHQLYLRSRDSRNLWSMPHATTFYKPAPQPGGNAVPDIVAAEFFLNTDPGPGNAIPVNVGVLGEETVLTFEPDISALEPGFHQLYVRSKDTRGLWSMPHATTFYKPAVRPGEGTVSDIVAMEFYIDSDPGYGKGEPVFGSFGPEAAAEFGINLPENLSIGYHTLALRAKDANGTWGLPVLSSFFKNEQHEIVAITPKIGGPGDRFRLTGQNFGPTKDDNLVLFGETAATIESVNAERTEMYGVVPQMPPGEQPVVLVIGATGVEAPETYTVLSPDFAASTNSLRFAVDVRTTRDTTIRIYNRGEARMDVSSIRFKNGLLSVTPGKAQLAIGDSLALTISFRPELKETRYDTLVIVTSARPIPFEIPVEAIGWEAEMDLTTQIIDYDLQPTGSSIERTLYVKNKGNKAFSVALVPPSDTTFRAFMPLNRAIAAGDSLPVTVRFRPRVANQVFFDSLRIVATNVKNAPALVYVRAESRPADVPLATIDVNEVVFAETGPGGTRRASVDVFNRSVVNVNISGQTGLSAPFFVVTRALPVTITAGQKTIWDIELRPTAKGTYLDTLVLATNGGALRIPLRAIVPEPVLTVSRATVVFGEVAVGDSVGSSLTLRSRNRIDARLLSATLKTQHFKLMPITGNLADSVIIGFHFRPGFFGEFTDTLRIKTDGGDFSALLSGRSPRPQPRAAAEVLAFESPVAGTPITKRLALLNSSINVATIRSLTVKDASVLVQAEGNRSRIVRGDTTWISVTFTPTNGKVLSDTLTVIADGPAPLKIALQSDLTVANEPEKVFSLHLMQNYPNPFNPSTQIRFTLAEAGMVTLTVYDISGREVARLANETLTAGEHVRTFDAAGLASGLYLYRLNAGNRLLTRKMMLLK